MISTIIFDFGDVFINLDKPAIERELVKLGVKQSQQTCIRLPFNMKKG